MAPTWMVLAVLWCSMVQTLLLPSFIWSCERYRADVRTVWEQCVAIMSEEDGDDGEPLYILRKESRTWYERLAEKQWIRLWRLWDGQPQDLIRFGSVLKTEEEARRSRTVVRKRVNLSSMCHFPSVNHPFCCLPQRGNMYVLYPPYSACTF